MMMVGSASLSSIFDCLVGALVAFARFAGLSDEGVFGDLRFLEAVFVEEIFEATFFGVVVFFFFSVLIFASFGSTFVSDILKPSTLV